MSQHLRKLEREAGVPLVDRSVRGGGRTIALTPAGRALADQSEQLAAALASAEREIDRYKGQRSAVVRVGGFASVFDHLVVPTAVSLTVTDPAVDLRIVEVDEVAGLEQLMAGQLDVLLSERSVSYGHARPAGIQETDLAHDPFRIVVPESWPQDMSDDVLLSGPWVLPLEQNAVRRALERIAITQGISLDVRHNGREASTVVSLVSAGLGAALVPQSALGSQSVRHVRVHTTAHDTGARILTVLQTDGTASFAVSRFVSELVRQSSGGGQSMGR